jgi:hypothetical protein
MTGRTTIIITHRIPPDLPPSELLILKRQSRSGDSSVEMHA